MGNRGLSRSGTLFFACSMLVACTQANVEESSGPVSAASEAASLPPASAEPTLSSSPSPTAMPSPTVAGPVEQSVGWSIPFTITTPADWDKDPASPMVFNFRSGPDRWLAFTQLGPETVEEWTDQLTSSSRYVVTDAAPVEVGGAAGVTFGLTLAEGEEEAILFQEATWGSWTVESERPNRVWILDVNGAPVMIVTDAPERAFDNWLVVVEEALTTLAWGE